MRKAKAKENKKGTKKKKFRQNSLSRHTENSAYFPRFERMKYTFSPALHF